MSKELENRLEETKAVLEKGFSKDAIEALQTEGIRREMLLFSNSIVKDAIKELEKAKETIQSPIYVGMLGRIFSPLNLILHA